MANYKKSFWASIVAFFIGSSCCWISSVAVWLGGAALVGTITIYLEHLQSILIVLGTVLGFATIVLYLRKR